MTEVTTKVIGEIRRSDPLPVGSAAEAPLVELMRLLYISNEVVHHGPGVFAELTTRDIDDGTRLIFDNFIYRAHNAGKKGWRLSADLYRLLPGPVLLRELSFYVRMEQDCVREIEKRTSWLQRGGRSRDFGDPGTLRYREDPTQAQGWEKRIERHRRGLAHAVTMQARIRQVLNDRPGMTVGRFNQAF